MDKSYTTQEIMKYISSTHLDENMGEAVSQIMKEFDLPRELSEQLMLAWIRDYNGPRPEKPKNLTILEDIKYEIPDHGISDEMILKVVEVCQKVPQSLIDSIFELVEERKYKKG
jgi:nitrogen regulatory protein PII-like uncharacterized protein